MVNKLVLIVLGGSFLGMIALIILNFSNIRKLDISEQQTKNKLKILKVLRVKLRRFIVLLKLGNNNLKKRVGESKKRKADKAKELNKDFDKGYWDKIRK